MPRGSPRSSASIASSSRPAPASARRVGFLRAPVAYEVVRSRYHAPDARSTRAAVNAMLARDARRGAAIVASRRARRARSRAPRTPRCAMSARATRSPSTCRCATSTPTTRRRLRERVRDALRASSSAARCRGVEVEILSWSITVSATVEPARPAAAADAAQARRPRATGAAPAVRRRRWANRGRAPVHWRDDAGAAAPHRRPGDHRRGRRPATVVPRGFDAAHRRASAISCWSADETA